MGTPIAAFPTRVATAADLKVANNGIQTTLVTPIGTADTTIKVASGAGFAANQLLSIDFEIVTITGITGTTITVGQRGFDGTAATAHVIGAPVRLLVDAWHHNAMSAEVMAIEQLLGPNGSNFSGGGWTIASHYIFTPQSPGGSLIAGANQFTLAPVPPGVNATDVNHYLYVSGGTGTAEAAKIVGGTAVAGSPSGTVILQCANAHSGTWTVASATGGIQEAIASLPAAGGAVLINSNVTLLSNVDSGGKTSVSLLKLAGTTIAGAYTLLGQSSAGDGRAETFLRAGPSDNAMRGTSPTWLAGRTPAYNVLEVNSGNYPFTTLNPSQFGANAIVGAIDAPAGCLVDGASGLVGLSTTSSMTTAAVGVSAYANTLVAGATAWGANFAVSNQLAPSGTTGVHAHSLIGLEIDCNVFSGGSDSITGLQIIGLNSTTDPTIAKGIEIAPLGDGSPTGVKWHTGLSFYTGATNIAIDLFPKNTGNNQGSQVIQFWSTDSGGTSRQSLINTASDGTLIFSGGNGSPASGLSMLDGAGNHLLDLGTPATQIVTLMPLPVYADNPTAKAAGLAVGRLYKTSTGQVMQVY
jgi:hypothetical protein